jgi:hypothetical protein
MMLPLATRISGLENKGVTGSDWQTQATKDTRRFISRMEFFGGGLSDSWFANTTFHGWQLVILSRILCHASAVIPRPYRSCIAYYLDRDYLATANHLEWIALPKAATTSELDIEKAAMPVETRSTTRARAARMAAIHARFPRETIAVVASNLGSRDLASLSRINQEYNGQAEHDLARHRYRSNRAQDTSASVQAFLAHATAARFPRVIPISARTLDIKSYVASDNTTMTQ